MDVRKWGGRVLIKHKISLSFLAAFILLVTLVAIDFQSDVSKADKIAQREAMAIAKTMAFTIVHTAEDMASSPEGKEKKFQQIIENFSEHQRRDIVVVDSQKR
ncbi:MAG: hypothetical protein GWN61_21080, partial [candidate division Zixibacteria bacterium]|nr:hypothetical protein [candidate division Zixibacteria bacterium]NIR66896.1 hypothetical protein [candidate division Zixibacteria bacterium]NIS45017.1 hypothetical protein [candidate division Zixibacteria bacterium]NIU13114.1 hypothetical protein [candidate division Zixibacteria bacterium]NIV08600.1 hypothetical protein [candidate division Zixibacteria bacterium]